MSRMFWICPTGIDGTTCDRLQLVHVSDSRKTCILYTMLPKMVQGYQISTLTFVGMFVINVVFTVACDYLNRFCSKCPSVKSMIAESCEVVRTVTVLLFSQSLLGYFFDSDISANGRNLFDPCYFGSLFRGTISLKYCLPWGCPFHFICFWRSCFNTLSNFSPHLVLMPLLKRFDEFHQLFSSFY